jgi:tetratricopeptide (TPR) repeat protein
MTLPLRTARSTLGALTVLLLLTVANGQVPDTLRQQALRGITSVDAMTRRDAVVSLGEVGSMADVTQLLEVLRDDDLDLRREAEQAIWRIWARSGDAKIDALYQKGVDAMESGDLRSAIATFTRVIAQKPDFAEGWNKRATLYFLVGELRKSLADCDEVIKRNPNHFGALAGYAQIYARLGAHEQALKYARRALALNPNLVGMREGIEVLERLIEERRKRTV